MGGKRRCEQPKDVAVVARVADDQKQDLGPVVAALQREPSQQRLDVAQPRLRLDGKGPSTTVHDQVPGAPIAGDPQRNLGSMSERRRQQRAEAAQQRELRGVPHDIAVRIRTEWQIESEGRAELDEGKVGHVRCLAVLDPADLGGRDPDRPAELGLGHGRVQPRFPVLVADRHERSSGEASGTVETALAGGHASMISAGAFLALIRADGLSR
jgi:hypothetical protein